MARRQIEIDRDTLRAAIRTFGADHVLYMRDDAIDLLPPGCSPWHEGSRRRRNDRRSANAGSGARPPRTARS